MVIILFAILSLYSLFLGLFNSVVIVTEGWSYFINHFDIQAFILTIFILFIISMCKSNKISKYILWIYYLLSTCCTLYIVFNLNNPIMGDDASTILRSSYQIYQNIINNEQIIINDYFFKAPWQTGLLLFDVMLYIISFNHIDIAFKLINTLCIFYPIFFYIN